jgi:hypothetical protein
VFASIAFPSPAAAQAPPPAAESSEIIVQGHRYRDQDVRDFIDALTDTRMGGQLSKFDWAVCPAAVGLSEHHRRAIANRMRQVATAAGMKVADATCRPNALVIVTSDKKQLIRALRKKYPAYFKDALGDRITPDNQPGPVTVWHVEGRVDSNGIAAGQDRQQKFYIVESYDSSRLNPASRPVFAAGILVVELKALAGLTSTQLADYAAMRLFARTDPARLKNGTAPTILHAIDTPMGGAVPITLTHWDLGFLRALYSAAPNQFANRQRNEMKQSLRKDLKKVQDRSDR